MISQEKKQEIIQALNSKQFNIRCPMCGKNSFTLADAYIRLELQDDLHNINLGGPSIPTASIICTNCGFVSLHALGILGLLNKDSPKENEDGKK
ncbi:MAG: hypothetical protein IKZ86_03765 [Spirochaetaceae bacterium]|nr:hypothetical protein [Spirochaetaceae bacterium]